MAQGINILTIEAAGTEEQTAERLEVVLEMEVDENGEGED